MSTRPEPPTRPPAPIVLTRRAFFRAAAVAGLAGAIDPDALLADPYAPSSPGSRRGLAVRCRGRVRSGGRGVPGVAVSDGVQVVVSGADGAFELVTTADRDHVRISVPAGFVIPRGPEGTARFYTPIPGDGSREMDALFDLERLTEPDTRHTLFLLADPQTADEQEMDWFHRQTVPDVASSLRSAPGEAFGIACGDIMYDRLELFPDYERGVRAMGIPFFQVVGNHDLDLGRTTDEAAKATFTRTFGPRWYSFDRGAVHYVVLDDVLWHGAGYVGHVPEVQIEWLRNDLALVEAGRPVVLATHIPLEGTLHLREGSGSLNPEASVANREQIYRLLEPYRAHVLVGHTHENEHRFSGRIHEHVVGTVCGAWWTGPICYDGTPSGYAVYEVDGEEIRWRYKATGEPPDHQIRVYAAGADPDAPDQVLANVWDHDPAWEVVWFEDGSPRGRMDRRVRTDPMSVELHAGRDRPPRRTWVEPVPTGHLFHAPLSPGTRDVRVEATDRFGRVYTAALDRPRGP